MVIVLVWSVYGSQPRPLLRSPVCEEGGKGRRRRYRKRLMVENELSRSRGLEMKGGGELYFILVYGFGCGNHRPWRAGLQDP